MIINLTSLLLIVIIFTIVGFSITAVDVYGNHQKISVILEPNFGDFGCQNTITGCINPSTINVHLGDSVTFTNNDPTNHHYFVSGTPAEGPDDIFRTGVMFHGTDFTWVSDSVGDIPYFCLIHPWMSGDIISVAFTSAFTPSSAPVVSAPVVSAPVVSAPVVSAPVVSAPVVSAPVVSAPIESKVTANTDTTCGAGTELIGGLCQAIKTQSTKINFEKNSTNYFDLIISIVNSESFAVVTLSIVSLMFVYVLIQQRSQKLQILKLIAARITPPKVEPLLAPKPMVKPTTQAPSIAEPIIKPSPRITPPKVEPLLAPKPMVKPTTQAPSIAEPIIKPIFTPSAKIIESIVKPIIKPIVKPIIKPIAEPIIKPIAEPIIKPIIKPIFTPSAKIIESIAEPIIKPIVKPIVAMPAKVMTVTETSAEKLIKLMENVSSQLEKFSEQSILTPTAIPFHYYSLKQLDELIRYNESLISKQRERDSKYQPNEEILQEIQLMRYSKYYKQGEIPIKTDDIFYSSLVYSNESTNFYKVIDVSSDEQTCIIKQIASNPDTNSFNSITPAKLNQKDTFTMNIKNSFIRNPITGLTEQTGEKQLHGIILNSEEKDTSETLYRYKEIDSITKKLKKNYKSIKKE